jgi:hypothetical protein
MEGMLPQATNNKEGSKKHKVRSPINAYLLAGTFTINEINNGEAQEGDEKECHEEWDVKDSQGINTLLDMITLAAIRTEIL